MSMPVHRHPKPPEQLHATGVAGSPIGLVRAVDFGVRADGVTDDTAALQRAIDTAGGTATVQLPAGTMVVTKPLKRETTAMWAPGLKIEGMGKGVTVIDSR